MRPRIALLAFAVLAVGAVVGLGVASGGAAVTGEWTIHLTSPSGDVLNTTITTPTTTTSTTSSTTSTTSSTTTTTVPPPGPGYPSFSEPFTRDGDFDSGCQLTGSADGAWNRIIGGPGGDHPGTISIVRSPVGEGSCAAEASIPAAGTVSDHTGRAAVQASSLAIPATYTWEALYYLPSGVHGVDHGSLNQTKQGGSGGGCANGGLYLDKNTDRLSFNTVASCSAGSIKHGFGPALAPRDRWFAVKVAEAFGDSGHVTLWFDGDGPGPGGYAQDLNFNADTMSGDSLKMDQGIYGDLQAVETHDFVDGFHLK
jgi:hypothetical protein